MLQIKDDVIIVILPSSELDQIETEESDEGYFVPTKKVVFLKMEEAKREMETEDFVKKFREIFPDDYKGNKKQCIINMNKFFKEFPEYSMDLILKVTAWYVRDCVRNKRFMRQAHYFIYKREVGSDLEGLCERFNNTGLTHEELDYGGRFR